MQSNSFRAVRVLLAVLALLTCSRSFAATPLDLMALRGHVVYLDFWASWCVPCRRSFPWMESLKATYQHQGLDIVAVNLDQDPADAQKFLAEFRPSFDVRFDPAGKTPEQFKVQGMPTSVLIDRQGRVRYTHVGFRPVDGATAESQLRELLAEK